MTRPLDGVRVADFSHILAGPYASYILGMLGADVIKIEPAGTGDQVRNHGPDVRYHGMAPIFMVANANKRSIGVDMKHPDGKAVVKRLIESADVVLENYKPGVIERLGFGYDAVKAYRPDIIYCSISGFGQSGRKRDHPAIDNIVQAMSGMVDLAAYEGEEGESVPFAVIDTYTGTLAALAIMGGLLRRAQTDEGQHIDLAMLDSAMALLSSVIVPYMVTGKVKARPVRGRAGSGTPTSGRFMARDGRQVSVAAVKDDHFVKLARLMGRPELAEDPRFSTSLARLNHAQEIVDILKAEFLKRDAAEWEAELNELAVPAGVIRDLPAAVAEPTLEERGVFHRYQLDGLPPEADPVTVGIGFHVDGEPRQVAPPPWYGEHTDAVLAELGYGAAERERLAREGIVIAGEARTSVPAEQA